MQHAPAQSAQRAVAVPRPVPLPVGGLNARDPLDGMKASDLLIADNVVIRSHGAAVRPGYYPVVTGLAGAVQTMAGYRLPDQPITVLAATPSKLYRMLSANGPAVELGTHSNGWLSAATLTNPGGTFLTMVNGVDMPRVWTGSTLLTPGYQPVWPLDQPVDGWSPTRLHQVQVHRTFMFFAERNSLRLWYLDHNAIAGPLRPFDLAPFCHKGGTIVAMASNSPDGGRTPGDQFFVVTSEGELVVYAGHDPNYAANWNLVGVYDVGIPTGRRCFADHGGTLYYCSQGGIVPLQKILSAAGSEQEYAAVTDKIRDLWYEIADDNSEALSFVDVGKAGFKIITKSDGNQVVIESQTKAWSTWSGLNALTFLEVDGHLMFGTSNGSIGRMDSDSDDGQPITCYIGHAYSVFGSQARKRFTRARLKFRRVAPAAPKIGVMTDYQDLPSRWSPQSIEGAYWKWAELNWASMPIAWTRSQITSAQNLWRGITGRGHAGAFLVSWQSVSPLVYTGADVMFEAGGEL